MDHHDLGTKDGNLLLFGGPYSNLQALDALLAVARARGIAGPEMICTGDVVAYCGDPEATVARIVDTGAVVVAGNCEVQLGEGAQDCGCGFEAGTACDLLSAGWFGFANARVGAGARAWMRRLPGIVTFQHHGARYAVIHGGVTDIARFIFATTAEAALSAEWDAVEARVGPVDHIMAGHSGIPFVRETPRGRWINAGVIGMPPHDGTPQTRYATLSEGAVELHALHYDAGAAATRMRAVGLTQGYDRALLTGYWPSEEVLPSALRRVSDSG